jgi:hypothetical protein
MVHAAQLFVAPPDDERSAFRRAVNFIAHARETEAPTIEVRVQDLSTDGCKIVGSVGLEPATQIWLRIRGFGARRAKVVWSRGAVAGCEFLKPLDPALVEQIASVAEEEARLAGLALLRGRGLLP